MSDPHRAPWTISAGVLTAVAGAALVVGSQLGDVPLAVSGGAFIGAAVLELVTGVSLRRFGAVWMPQVFAGVVGLAFGLCLLALLAFDGRALTAAPAALILGVFCVTNALFRGLDLLVEQPPALFSEVTDVVVTFALGAAMFAVWREATPAMLAVVVGTELVAGGACITASARAVLHPEYVHH